MEEPRQPLDYASEYGGNRTSVAGIVIKVIVAIAGAFLIFRLAMWRLFGNAPM